MHFLLGPCFLFLFSPFLLFCPLDFNGCQAKIPDSKSNVRVESYPRDPDNLAELKVELLKKRDWCTRARDPGKKRSLGGGLTRG